MTLPGSCISVISVAKLNFLNNAPTTINSNSTLTIRALFALARLKNLVFHYFISTSSRAEC